MVDMCWCPVGQQMPWYGHLPEGHRDGAQGWWWHVGSRAHHHTCEMYILACRVAETYHSYNPDWSHIAIYAATFLPCSHLYKLCSHCDFSCSSCNHSFCSRRGYRNSGCSGSTCRKNQYVSKLFAASAGFSTAAVNGKCYHINCMISLCTYHVKFVYDYSHCLSVLYNYK